MIIEESQQNTNNPEPTREENKNEEKQTETPQIIKSKRRIYLLLSHFSQKEPI
jgi:hypothetical protein